MYETAVGEPPAKVTAAMALVGFLAALGQWFGASTLELQAIDDGSGRLADYLRSFGLERRPEQLSTLMEAPCEALAMHCCPVEWRSCAGLSPGAAATSTAEVTGQEQPAPATPQAPASTARPSAELGRGAKATPLESSPGTLPAGQVSLSCGYEGTPRRVGTVPSGTAAMQYSSTSSSRRAPEPGGQGPPPSGGAARDKAARAVGSGTLGLSPTPPPPQSPLGGVQAPVGRTTPSPGGTPCEGPARTVALGPLRPPSSLGRAQAPAAPAASQVSTAARTSSNPQASVLGSEPWTHGREAIGPSAAGSNVRQLPPLPLSPAQGHADASAAPCRGGRPESLRGDGPPHGSRPGPGRAHGAETPQLPAAPAAPLHGRCADLPRGDGHPRSSFRGARSAPKMEDLPSRDSPLRGSSYGACGAAEREASQLPGAGHGTVWAPEADARLALPSENGGDPALGTQHAESSRRASRCRQPDPLGDLKDLLRRRTEALTC